MSALCALAVAVPIAATASAAPQREIAERLFNEWLEAVENHRPGRRDEAAARVVAWDAMELDHILRRFKTHQPRAGFNHLVLRAATLHADIAMWQWDAVQGSTEPPPARGASDPHRSAVFIVDGRYLETADVTAHWSLARQMIDALRPTAMGHEFARLWYRATTAYLVGNSSYTDALAHVERAKALFPKDAFFDVAAGCVHEAFASTRVQEGARQARMLDGSRLGGATMASAEVSLLKAEVSYSRAVKLDPASMDARLRLGRVLARQNKPSAASHFEAVLSGTRDDTVRYYAFLFLGERREASGQFAAAAEAYGHAAALFPGAQSAALALSQLARRTGDRGASERLLDALGPLSDQREKRDDPWWYYDGGIGREARSLLADLHAALAKRS